MSFAPFESLLRPLGAVADALLGARGCLLTFHRLAPTALWERLPDRNFYLDSAYLDRLIVYLKAQGWAIVTMDEALERASADRRGDRFVNFSVDDAYRDSFEEIAPLFRRHGAPFTLFVTTGIPDRSLVQWRAGLEDGLLRKERVRVDGRDVEAASDAAKRRAYAEIASGWEASGDAEARYAKFCSDNGLDPEELHAKHAISWELLEKMRSDPLIEIGAHSVDHLRYADLEEKAVLADMLACRARLRDRLDAPIRHFAYPYGRSGDAGAREFELARRAGFVSAATTRKGLLRKGVSPFALPRNTLNGGARSLAMAEIHLTGLSGLVAKGMGRV